MTFLGAYFLIATPVLVLFGFQGLVFLIPLIAALAAGRYMRGYMRMICLNIS
jgi:hypothetical protein